MLVSVVETGAGPGGPRWAGRRHDDDRPGASSGTSQAGLFDAVFAALHDGEQVALGFDCPLTVPGPRAQPAPGELEHLLGELEHLLGELAAWRPWTTVSTSLSRWKANTSIVVWEAVPAEAGTSSPASSPSPTAPPSPPSHASPGEGARAAAAAESFFLCLKSGDPGEESAGGAVVNLAAAAAHRAGLLADPSELSRPAVKITVTSG